MLVCFFCNQVFPEYQTFVTRVPATVLCTTCDLPFGRRSVGSPYPVGAQFMQGGGGTGGKCEEGERRTHDDIVL